MSNCRVHPAVPAIVECTTCGTPLCEECVSSPPGEPAQCGRCIALAAAADFRRDEVEQQQRRAREPLQALAAARRRRLIQGTFVVVALGVTGAVMANLFASRMPPRDREVSLQERTDRCIANLLQIAAALQRGESIPSGLRCPASGHAYLVSSGDGDMVVSDPNPEMHDYRVMTVSRRRPVPELIQ